MELSKRLIEIREDYGYTRKRLSDELDIPYGTITKYESGEREPGHNYIVKLAQKFGLTTDYVLGIDFETKKAPPFTSEAIDLMKKFDQLDTWGRNTVQAVIVEELKRCTALRTEPEEDTLIMLFSQNKASAGTGWELGEDSTERWTVLLNELTRKADFCVKVDGDSMEPRYYNGDIILVRKQPSIDLGEIGLYTFDGHGYVKKQGNNCLISLNTKYPNITPEQYAGITCIGLVLGKLEPEWIRSK